MTYRPEEAPSLTPMLAVRNAEKAIEWYKMVFNATEKFRLVDQAGTIVHAEILINEHLIMLAEKQGRTQLQP